MQSLLRRTSVCSDLVANASDPSAAKDQEGTRPGDRSGQLGEKKEGENQAMNNSSLNMELERERTLNRSTTEQHEQTRSRSTSPARSAALLNASSMLLQSFKKTTTHTS